MSDEDDEDFRHYESDQPETWLDQALRLRTDLQATKREEIESIYSEFPDLWVLLLELNDGGQGAGPGLAKALGVNISLLNKFVKQHNRPVSVRDARTIADRIVTYLRSQEAVPAVRVASVAPLPKAPEEPQPQRERVIRAVEWRLVVRTAPLEAQISEVSRLIGEVIRHSSLSNLSQSERGLTEAERERLIQVLRSALKVLEAPMMEKGLLQEASAGMKRGMAKVMQKGTEQAFLIAGTLAIEHLDTLVHLIFKP